MSRDKWIRVFVLPFLVMQLFLIANPLALARASIVVGFSSNVRVNDVVAGPQMEPSVAANPVNTQNLIAAYEDQALNPYKCVSYTSGDLGRTWTGRTLRPTGAIDFCSDPVVRFRSDGVAYLVYLHYFTQSAERFTTQLAIQNSTDGGLTWGNEVTIASGLVIGCPGDPVLDKPWLAIDSANSVIYVSYTHYFYDAKCTYTNQVGLYRSTDGGQTWSGTDVTPVGALGELLQASNLAVGTDGSLFVAWYDSLLDGYFAGQFAIDFKRSTDRGVSFPASATRIVTAYETQKQLPNLMWRVWATMGPKMVAGLNPSNPSYVNIYLVYGARPQAQGTGTDEADIFFSKSTDSGATWSSSIRLNTDSTDTPQFFPSIAVHDTNNLHVTYGDMSINSALPYSQYQIVHRQSSDGGVSWQAGSQSVTNAVSDSLNSAFLGDYFDIATSGARVIPIWADRRSGNNLEDIYTAVSALNVFSNGVSYITGRSSSGTFQNTWLEDAVYHVSAGNFIPICPQRPSTGQPLTSGCYVLQVDYTFNFNITLIPKSSISSLAVGAKAHMGGSSSTYFFSLSFYNYASATWDLVDNKAYTTSDVWFTNSFNKDHVDSNGNMKVEWYALGPSATLYLDYMYVSVYT